MVLKKNKHGYKSKERSSSSLWEIIVTTIKGAGGCQMHFGLDWVTSLSWTKTFDEGQQMVYAIFSVIVVIIIIVILLITIVIAMNGSYCSRK